MVRDLRLLPVWVNPQHLVLTALHVMLGHKVKALGVLDGSKLVGTVALEDLLGAPEGANVGSVMRPLSFTVDSNLSVREAARRFTEEELDFAPVMSGDHFLGVLTPVMLLKELDRSYDPLTKLSWSDRLREWGIEHLRNNEEVTILFIDLNQFGIYNKKYGHIVGDQVIQKVAAFLAEHIDPELDVLVRYGGDEFAIGTLRDRDESEALAELLMKRFQGDIDGADEPVSFCIGVFGGRRHRERESIHYAATIDNLINIASKNCIARKRAMDEPAAPPPSPVVQPPFKVLGIYTDEGDDPITTVILGRGDEVFSGADTKGAKSIVESISFAAARALERATQDSGYEISAIDLFEEGESHIVTVTGKARMGAISKPVSAARRVKVDLANTVVEATVAAFAA